MDKETAKLKGLVNWKKRWVSTEERKQLKKEYNSYMGIRTVYVLCFIGAVIGGLQALNALSAGSGIAGLIDLAMKISSHLT